MGFYLKKDKNETTESIATWIELPRADDGKVRFRGNYSQSKIVISHKLVAKVGRHCIELLCTSHQIHKTN